MGMSPSWVLSELFLPWYFPFQEVGKSSWVMIILLHILILDCFSVLFPVIQQIFDQGEAISLSVSIGLLWHSAMESPQFGEAVSVPGGDLIPSETPFP